MRSIIVKTIANWLESQYGQTRIAVFNNSNSIIAYIRHAELDRKACSIYIDDSKISLHCFNGSHKDYELANELEFKQFQDDLIKLLN